MKIKRKKRKEILNAKAFGMVKMCQNKKKREKLRRKRLFRNEFFRKRFLLRFKLEFTVKCWTNLIDRNKGSTSHSINGSWIKSFLNLNWTERHILNSFWNVDIHSKYLLGRFLIRIYGILTRKTDILISFEREISISRETILDDDAREVDHFDR